MKFHIFILDRGLNICSISYYTKYWETAWQLPKASSLQFRGLL